MTAWVFVTDCVSSDGESINAMKEAESPSSFREMSRIVGAAFRRRQLELGYEVGTGRGELRLSRDWHVSYHRSVYRGRPCFYFVWSGIEQVFCADVGSEAPTRHGGGR